MSDQTRLPPFRVTQAAIDQIVCVGGAVRIDVQAGGCSGQTWVFTQDAPRPTDEAFGCPGAVLAVSAAAVPLLDMARLDYGAGLRPPRYRVLGVQHEVCPCRRSFGLPWPGRGQDDCRAATPMPWDANTLDGDACSRRRREEQ